MKILITKLLSIALFGLILEAGLLTFANQANAACEPAPALNRIWRKAKAINLEPRYYNPNSGAINLQTVLNPCDMNEINRTLNQLDDLQGFLDERPGVQLQVRGLTQLLCSNPVCVGRVHDQDDITVMDYTEWVNQLMSY